MCLGSGKGREQPVVSALCLVLGLKWGARDAEYSLSGPLDQTHTLSPEILKPS